MMRRIFFVAAVALLASSASAQLPGLRKRGPAQPVQPVLQGIDALRADFAAQSGGTMVYFGVQGVVLGVPAKAVLTAQAAWLRRHPDIVVRIEGYGDSGDTRNHALAVGARRAEAARDQLLLLGVPAAQVSVTSWGKERGGLPRAITVLVR
jgi:peptidoglycan-associated lipoprotein